MSERGPKYVAFATAVGLMASFMMPNRVEVPISSQDRANIEHIFNDTKAYWASRGVSMPGVSLVLIARGQQQVCSAEHGKGREIIPGDWINSQYCASRKAVIVTEAWIEKTATSHFATKPEMLDFTVAHEVGHGVQDTKDMLDYDPNDITRTLPIETQADCLAGVALQHIRPAEITDITHELTNGWGFDLSHGIGSQRADFFSQEGAQNQNCTQTITDDKLGI